MNDLQPLSGDPEDQLTPETRETTPAPVCVHCKQREPLEGYPTRLCAECRQYFIHYPIPNWIKAFAAGILVVVVFACFSLPRQLSTEINKAKGEKAEGEGRFVTASRAFQKASKDLPGDVELNCHLFICAAYCGDIGGIRKYWALIEGKTIEDEALRAQVSEAVNVVANYTPSDVLDTLSKQFPDRIPDTTYSRAMKQYPDDLSIALTYAGALYNENKYDSCAALLSGILGRDKSDVPALTLAGFTAVERKQPDSAIYYCDQLLQINREDITALSSKARNLLRLGKDQDAVEPAEKAYELNDTLPYTIGTMILLYHFTNQQAKRDQLIRKARTFSDSSDKAAVKYIFDVVDGKEPFRTTK